MEHRIMFVVDFPSLIILQTNFFIATRYIKTMIYAKATKLYDILYRDTIL